MFSIVALGSTTPKEAAYMTAFWALMVAICSATQDIVIDAYRVEILSKNQQGAGAAMVVFGYRVGMLISSAGALILAEYTSWQISYLAMAMLLPVAMIVVMFLGEPELKEIKRSGKSWKEKVQEWVKTAVIYPFLSFMRRKGWISLVIFIILYKFGDAFAGIMTNPFLVELGFSKTEIAAVVKTFGFAATIVGAILGGVLVDKLGIVRSLWICGILQMFSNLVFLVQYWVGKDVVMLSVTIACENLAGGMGTAAFVAFISALCNRHYTATQYALLSSLASVGRTWLSSSSGWTVDMVGWEWFFILSTAIALPGLILLYWIRGSYLKESYLDTGSKS
jgi:PAT family beta-lactamase induction signal transducer AmpG